MFSLHCMGQVYIPDTAHSFHGANGPHGDVRVQGLIVNTLTNSSCLFLVFFFVTTSSWKIIRITNMRGQHEIHPKRIAQVDLSLSDSLSKRGLIHNRHSKMSLICIVKWRDGHHLEKDETNSEMACYYLYMYLYIKASNRLHIRAHCSNLKPWSRLAHSCRSLSPVSVAWSG